MKICRHIASIVLLSVMLGTTCPTFAADPHIATTFVKQRHLGNNLSLMGFSAAKKTPAFDFIRRKLGQERAENLVRQEMAVIQPKYQEQWDSNLAASYAALFSADELQSLVADGSASPVAAKFIRMVDQVGRNMQAKSSNILTSFVEDSLVVAVIASNQIAGDAAQ